MFLKKCFTNTISEFNFCIMNKLYNSKTLKKLFRHINIVNYVICDFYALVWSLFYCIIRYIFFDYNNYSAYHKICDMKDFEIQGSAIIVVILFTPWALLIAYITRLFAEQYFMNSFLITEIIIALIVFYSIYSSHNKCFSIKRLERLRDLKLRKWRLNVLCLLLIDFFLTAYFIFFI